MAFAAEVIEPFRAATPPADPNGPATPLAEAMSRYIHGTLIIQAAVAVLTLYSIYYWYKVHEKYQAAKAGDASYKPAGCIGTYLAGVVVGLGYLAQLGNFGISFCSGPHQRPSMVHSHTVHPSSVHFPLRSRVHWALCDAIHPVWRRFCFNDITLNVPLRGTFDAAKRTEVDGDVFHLSLGLLISCALKLLQLLIGQAWNASIAARSKL